MQRVIVYVDGYNLYYSRLRGTPFKWLDLVVLFRDRLLHQQMPDAELVALKYFTAPALARFATRGTTSVAAQNAYHRALQVHHAGLVEIIQGFHSTERAPMIRYRHPPDRTDRADVWRIEEKQTDVNIALSIYRDVSKGEATTVVLCSNDSDMVPVLKAIREDFTAVTVGVVAPLPEPIGKRPASVELHQLADWARRYIRDDELAASLLPDMIPTRKKAIRRPGHW